MVDGHYFTNRTKEVGLVKRVLDIEMRLAGIDFSREHDMPIYYRNELIGMRNPISVPEN